MSCTMCVALLLQFCSLLHCCYSFAVLHCCHSFAVCCVVAIVLQCVALYYSFTVCCIVTIILQQSAMCYIVYVAVDIGQRSQHINDYFMFSLYCNVCRSLFEKHKLLFAFLLSIRRLQYEGGINMVQCIIQFLMLP